MSPPMSAGAMASPFDENSTKYWCCFKKLHIRVSCLCVIVDGSKLCVHIDRLILTYAHIADRGASRRVDADVGRGGERLLLAESLVHDRRLLVDRRLVRGGRLRLTRLRRLQGEAHLHDALSRLPGHLHCARRRHILRLYARRNVLESSANDAGGRLRRTRPQG